MSWSLVGQIVVLTLLAIVVLIVVAGFIIGIHQHVTGKASANTYVTTADGEPLHTHQIRELER
jgi:hypothetical protein